MAQALLKHTVQAALLLLLAPVVNGATAYRLIDPGIAISSAHALNNSNQVVGVVREGTGHSGFLWNDGELTNLGVEAFPRAINDDGTVVGFTAAFVNDAYFSSAWMYSNGTFTFLVPDSELSNSATDINNSGQVVGSIGSEGYLLTDPPLWLTGPLTGVGPFPSASVHAIADDGTVLASLGDAGYLVKDLGSPSDWAFLPMNTVKDDIWTIIRGTDLSSDGSVVGGYFKYALGFNQPITWKNERATILGAPGSNAIVTGVNDTQMAVGFALPTVSGPGLPDLPDLPMLWINPLGIALEDLVELPPGTRLTEPVAINDHGVILAHLEQYGASRFVLLEPAEELPANPGYALERPAEGAVFTVPDVTVELAAAGSPAEITHVLHHRVRIDATGIPPNAWQPASYNSGPFRTNTLPAGERTMIFTGMAPGQYAITTSVKNSDGIRFFLPPRFFAVTGAAALEVFRIKFNGRMDWRLIGSPGRLYDLESSPDLAHWTSLERGTEGGVFETNPTGDQLYYRAKVVDEGIHFFERGGYYTSAPASIDGSMIAFFYTDVEPAMEGPFLPETLLNPAIELQLSNGSFTGSVEHIGTTEGTYEYAPKLGNARFHAVSTGALEWELHAELEFPIVASNLGPLSPAPPAEFRGVTIYAGVRKEVRGHFSVSYR